MITTKRKAGPPSVTYSGTASYTRRPRYSDRAIYLMNSKERVDVSRELVEREFITIMLIVGPDTRPRYRIITMGQSIIKSSIVWLDITKH